jgi:hypothetical protein
MKNKHICHLYSAFRLTFLKNWLRGQDSNLRPRGYEPHELPDCSTPLYIAAIVTSFIIRVFWTLSNFKSKALYLLTKGDFGCII